ncbi:MAG: acylneuraminate cytidylyltransferase family protein [bacterium]
MKTILSLITARGGSKGIPRKNVLDVGGKPLIAWSIEAALQSRASLRVVVSTDDEEIAQISLKYGAEVPFVRPAELATDTSDHMSVVIHALEWLKTNESYVPDYVLVLQPTSPMRTSQDIDGAVELAYKNEADGVVSVCETHHHPYLLSNIDSDGILVDYLERSPAAGSSNIRRQDMPPVYFQNGAIYLTRREVLIAARTLTPPKTYPYIMPASRSLQIDDQWELEMIDMLLSKKCDV